jgi:hypothetical protein
MEPWKKPDLFIAESERNDLKSIGELTQILGLV